jgi:hypothetical protein
MIGPNRATGLLWPVGKGSQYGEDCRAYFSIAVKIRVRFQLILLRCPHPTAKQIKRSNEISEHDINCVFTREHLGPRAVIECFSGARTDPVQSPHASPNSLERAKIWFPAACSLSSSERLSGGPSIPTVTRPESSPRPEVNVNL